MRSQLIIIFLFFFFQSQAQIIPAEKRTDWSVAGYGGQLPKPDNVVNVKDFGALGNGIDDDYQSIINAINFLNGEFGVVYFPAGEYFIGTSISLPDSIILRGEDKSLVELKFDLGETNSNCINISKAQNLIFTKIISGFNKGSEKIIVNDVSSFEKNCFAEIRQKNGPWDINPASWAEYAVGQIIKITDIKGDTLFIDRALRIDYDTSLNLSVSKIIPIQNVGVEKLKIHRIDCPEAGGGTNINFNYAVKCWVNDIESDKSVGSHIHIYTSRNIQITHNYIHDAFFYTGESTRGYGVTLSSHACECLIQDNIFKHLRHAMMIKTGANANVFGYNYSIEPYRSETIHDFSGDISVHGHYAFLNLFEGNIVQNIIIDHYWGPGGPYNTFFRNRAELYGIIMTNNEILETKKQNFVGNEVTNLNFLYGNYILTGSNHFEYGNNIKGNILPPDTDSLPDSSYYLTNIPDFWNVPSQWPSLGIPNALNSGTIPAKERYDSLFLKINDFNSTDDFKINIFPNPSFDGIFIVIVNSENYSNGFLTVNNSILKSVLYKKIVLNKGKNIFNIDISRFSKGIYFLIFKINNKIYSYKIIKI